MKIIDFIVYRNSKFYYFAKNFLYYLLPNFIFRRQLHHGLSKLDKYDRDHIIKRVNYYNKLDGEFYKDADMVKIKEFKLRVKLRPHVYFFDIYEHMRYFPKDNYFSSVFGDVTDIPKIPSIVKSRPICEGEATRTLCF